MPNKLQKIMNLPNLKSPLDFSINDITDLDLQVLKKCIKGIVLSRKINIGELQSKIIDTNNIDTDNSKYLRDIAKYLIALIKIETRNINLSIEQPQSNQGLPKYYFAYLIGFKSHKKNVLEKVSFSLLVDIYSSLVNDEIKDNVLDIIIKSISKLKPKFYLDSSLSKKFLDNIHKQDLKEDIVLLISEVRNKYILENQDDIEHQISRSSRLILTKSRGHEHLLTSKAPIDGWIEITIPAARNFLDLTQDQAISIQKPSLFDLLKYSAHIVAPALTEFSFTITGYPNPTLNEQLREHLRINGLLNSANQITAPFLYIKRTSPNPPALKEFKAKILEFFRDRFLILPWPEGQITSIIDKSFMSGKEARLNAKKLENFHPFRALSLTIESLEYNDLAKIPDHLKDALLADAQRNLILDLLYDTLLIAFRNFENSKIAVQDSKEQGFFTLSEAIVQSKLSSPGAKLIIQSGNPIELNQPRTNHYFYVVITKFSENYKINIVNGGSSPDEDPSVDLLDKGKGGNYWMCRTIISKDSSGEFIKHYIYRVLSIQYTSISTTSLDNLYVKNNQFIGFRTYNLDLSNINSILTIEQPSECPIFPSQTFANCTIHNLKQALKILFNWRESQFTLFANDLFIRYNFLLKQKSEDRVLHITNSKSETLSSTTEESFIESIIEERDELDGGRLEFNSLIPNSFLFAEQIIKELNWFIKKRYFSDEIQQFNYILHGRGIDKTIEAIQNPKDFRFIKLKLHPDKGGQAKDFTFVCNLKEKMLEEIDYKLILVEDFQKKLIFANKHLAIINLVIDIAKIAHLPTWENFNSLIVDSSYALRFAVGTNKYSQFFSSIIILNQLVQGNIYQAFDHSFTAALYFAPKLLGSYLGIPYIGLAFSSYIKFNQIYKTLNNLNLFFQQYSNKNYNLETISTYKNLSEFLSFTPLQKIYDFNSIAKDYEIKISLEILKTKGTFGKKIHLYIYKPLIEEKYEIQDQIFKEILSSQQAENKRSKIVKLETINNTYNLCREVIELDFERTESYFCINENQETIDHIKIIDGNYIEDIIIL